MLHTISDLIMFFFCDFVVNLQACISAINNWTVVLFYWIDNEWINKMLLCTWAHGSNTIQLDCCLCNLRTWVWSLGSLWINIAFDRLLPANASLWYTFDVFVYITFFRCSVLEVVVVFLNLKFVQKFYYSVFTTF